MKPKSAILAKPSSGFCRNCRLFLLFLECALRFCFCLLSALAGGTATNSFLVSIILRCLGDAGLLEIFAAGTNGCTLIGPLLLLCQPILISANFVFCCHGTPGLNPGLRALRGAFAVDATCVPSAAVLRIDVRVFLSSPLVPWIGSASLRLALLSSWLLSSDSRKARASSMDIFPSPSVSIASRIFLPLRLLW